MNFDQALFFNTYNKLLSEKSFRDVFYEVFIPLIQEIGLLWQTNTISPSHEHFITYLIKQKILTNTEVVQSKEPTKSDKVFVLYLPMNEIHELGLMYLNYEILNHGYKTIYLGESVPTESLKDLKKHFDNIVYLCYSTVEPTKSEINPYVKELQTEIMDDSSQLWLIGRMIEFVEPKLVTEKTLTFSSIKELVEFI
jgi:methanogenic corrinoid protein MtbC1